MTKVICPIGSCKSTFSNKKNFEEHLWNNHFWSDLAIYWYFDIKNQRKRYLAKLIANKEFKL